MSGSTSHLLVNFASPNSRPILPPGSVMVWLFYWAPGIPGLSLDNYFRVHEYFLKVKKFPEHSHRIPRTSWGGCSPTLQHWPNQLCVQIRERVEWGYIFIPVSWEINKISFKNALVYSEALQGSLGEGVVKWTYKTKQNIGGFGQNFQTQVIANSNSSTGLSELGSLNNILL